MKPLLTGLALLGTLSCAGQSSSPSREPLTQEALESGLYSSKHTGIGPVRLADGRWSREDQAGQQSLTLSDLRRFGDLDGDGDEDAVVVLVIWGGGSGVFNELAAVINDAGQPVHAASLPLGDRVKIEALDLAADRIRVKMIVHDGDDAACCPTLALERQFLFREGSLTEESGGS